jgi:hypothetical protein
MSEPRPPSEELIRLLSRFELRVGELGLALRAMILEEAPFASERIFDTYALALTYSLTDKWADSFCHVVVYTKHVNLGFNRGAELNDPDGRLEGSGKLIRHIKVKRGEDLTKPYLRRFIRAAIKHAKSRSTAEPKGGRSKRRVQGR